jgi:hypothetical protein
LLGVLLCLGSQELQAIYQKLVQLSSISQSWVWWVPPIN